MLKASMVSLLTLFVQAQECDKTNLFQVKRTMTELGKQPEFLELNAAPEVITCPGAFATGTGNTENSCKTDSECGNLPSLFTAANPAANYKTTGLGGLLADGCWGNTEQCTEGETLYYTGKTDTKGEVDGVEDDQLNIPTLCFKVPENVCPTRVCIKTGNGGQGKFCYNTENLSCKDNDCTQWQPGTNSGPFCITAASGISNFAIEWKCCPAGEPDVGPPPGSAVGDPHMRTLDGEKYLLLKQGSFIFWQFSGLDAEAQSAGAVKKIPLDFRVFTHYSGRRSFTKGLLLVDQSGPDHSKHQSLEITSEDCTWHSQTAGSTWHAVEKPASFVSDQDGVSAMRLGFSTGPGELMHVELLMKEKNSLRQIAKVIVICKPHMHINTKLVMFHKEDFKYVTGQLARHTEKAQLLQTSKFGSLLGNEQKVRTDSDFLTTQSWTDLGGSESATAYLSAVDQEEPVQFTALLQECDKQSEDKAKVLCAKHLVGIPPAELEDIMAECVFDVCREGGEVAAKLFAEIYTAQ